jgi:hypothetical protein
VRRVPIQLKVAAALTVPVLALAVVTGIGVLGAGDQRAEVQRQTDLARAAIGPAGVLTSLQNERLWNIAVALELEEQLDLPVDSFDEAWGATDEALADLERRVTAGDQAIADAFGPALASFEQLRELRIGFQAFEEGSRRTTAETVEYAFGMFDRYTELMTPLFDASTNLAADIEDEELRQGTEVSDTTARAIEAMTVLASRTVTIALISDGGVDERAEIVELSQLRASLRRHVEVLRLMPEPYADVVAGQAAITVFDGIDANAQEAISTGRFDFAAMIGAVNLDDGGGVFSFQDELNELIVVRADEIETAAADRQLQLVALTLICLFVVILINVTVSRSITSPLHSLTRQARELAGARLPAVVKSVLDQPLGAEVRPPEVEPVQVESSREVESVVSALNDVQGTVVDLAMNQALYRRNMADLFLSLGGRNNELLRRQNQLVADLARPTAKPEVRAGAAQLDHLASQMRRNSESLLAVAGIDVRRRRRSDEAVRIEEVVHAALETVEGAERVVVRGLEPAALAGGVVSDIVHVIGELVETALDASTPGHQIEVRGGHRTETDGYWLAVVDFGSGLPDDELAAANRRTAGDDSVPASAAGPVGYVVAGHLARRAGVSLRLDSSPGWGIMATIEVPRTHLAAIPPAARPGARPPSGPDAPTTMMLPPTETPTLGGPRHTVTR